jgi:hypothetical protein
MTDIKVEFIYQEAYGYEINVTIVEWDDVTQAWIASDISSFPTKQFKIEKPDRTDVTVIADFDETDGKNGILVYTVPSGLGLFNQVGWYQLQAIIANASQYFPTSKVGFTVDDPL